YAIFQERGYRARLLAAAYRHHLHWSELVGGDIVLTIPYAWQRLFNESDIEVVPRMDQPVPDEVVSELYRHLPDFRRAFDSDGMTVDEFDSYGATVRTLRGFIASYQELVATVRDFMLPNPAVARPRQRRAAGGGPGPPLWVRSGGGRRSVPHDAAPAGRPGRGREA